MATRKPPTKDDGSLAYLNIPRDVNNRSFHCAETSQRLEVGKTFYVMNFIEDVPTRYSRRDGSEGRTLVLIADDPKDKEESMRKFFTGSADILYILKEIKAREAFPRRVTLKADGNRYYFE